MVPTGDQDVVYLTVDDVLSIHAEIFGSTDDEARLRLRAPAVLESALARPEQYAHYQGADLPMQAAVMAHAIAEGQPFLDGNKRTAAITLDVFLDLNGLTLTLSNEDLATFIWWFSAGLSPAVFAELIRPHVELRG